MNLLLKILLIWLQCSCYILQCSWHTIGFLKQWKILVLLLLKLIVVQTYDSICNNNCKSKLFLFSRFYYSNFQISWIYCNNFTITIHFMLYYAYILNRRSKIHKSLIKIIYSKFSIIICS